MNLGDPIDDRQAQPRAAALGGEKRLEQPLPHLLAQARSTVGHFEFQAIASHARGDFEPSTLGHRVESIHRKVHHGAAEHGTVGIHPKLSGNIGRGFNVTRRQLRSERTADILDELTHIDPLQLGFFVAGEVQQAFDICRDHPDARFHLLQNFNAVWIAGQPRPQQSQARRQACHFFMRFVSQLRSQLAHIGEPVLAGQFAVFLFKLFR